MTDKDTREAYRAVIRHTRRAETEITRACKIVESAPAVPEGYFISEMENILEAVRAVVRSASAELERYRRRDPL